MAGMRSPLIKVNCSSDEELLSVKEIAQRRRESETHHEGSMKRKHKSASGVNQRGESPPKKIKHEEQEQPSETLSDGPPDLTTSNGQTERASNGIESLLFVTRRSSLYVPLSPISNEHPLDGICAEHLSPLILTYYPPFKGVVLAYEDVTLSNQPDETSIQSNEPVFARALDEYAASYMWVTANFLLFCPKKGQEIEGHVTLQNESHIGLVCWNYFSASISRDRLPSAWTWVSHSSRKKHSSKRSHEKNGQASGNQWDAVDGDTGYFRDGQGKRVEDTLSFRVAEIDLTSDLYREKSALSLRGTLLSMEDEESLQATRKTRSRPKKS